MLTIKRIDNQQPLHPGEITFSTPKSWRFGRWVFRLEAHGAQVPTRQFSRVYEDSKQRPATFSAAKDTATLGVAAGMVESPERLKKSTASRFST